MTAIFIVTAVASAMMAVLFFVIPVLPQQPFKLSGETVASTNRQVGERPQGIGV